jgi:predicted permease
VEPGFDAERATAFWLSLPPATYVGDSAVVRFTARLLEEVERIPGVRAAGIGSKLPLNTAGQGYTPVWPDNDRSPSGTLPPVEQLVTVTGGYFAAMGIPLLAGRTFEPLARQPAYEAIVDRALAVRYWEDSTGARAIGRRLTLAPLGGAWYTVVGVVGTVHDTSLASPPTGHVYLPQVVPPDTNQSMVDRRFALVVRTTDARAGSAAVVRAVQHAVHGLDPSLPAFDVGALAMLVERSTARIRFVMIVLAVAATVALALAMVGIYGTLGYLVSLRTKEIGVRIALGATPASVARLVTRQGIALTALGILAGGALFAALSRFLRTMLFGVRAGDPVTIAAVAAGLLVVALLASWLPARRAAAVDPMEALRRD